MNYYQGKNGKWYANVDAANTQGGGYTGVRSTPNNPVSGAPNASTSSSSSQTTSSQTNTGGASTSSPSQNTQWQLSAWNIDGNGNWTQKPTLTVNGQTFQYDNPQDYINKMNELKSQGVSGNIDTFINQLKTVAVPAYQNKPASTSLTADQLVDRALIQYKTNVNLDQQSWWKTDNGAPIPDAVRQAAYSKIQSIFSNPSNLAQYVVSKGIQNLSGYSWWSGSNIKDAAWSEVQKLNGTTGAPSSATATSADTTTPVGTVQSAPTRSSFTSDADYQRALAEYNATGSWSKSGTAPVQQESATPPNGDYYGKDSLGNYLWSSDFEPASLKNNSYYQSLPDESKLQVRYSYFLMQQNNVEKTQDFLKVLESAKSSSDVLFGQKLRLQYDELSSFLEDRTGDYQRRNDRLTKNIDEINARISDATLEERAALEKEKRAYEQQLETTQNQLAGAGLTSSSIRDKAEARLAAEDQSIVEATKRQSEATRRGLQLQNTGYQTDLAQSAADKAEELKTAARKLEEVLGTTEYQKIRSTYGQLPEAIGTTADAFGKIVPITGTRKTEQLSDVQTRLSSLLGLTTPITFPK